MYFSLSKEERIGGARMLHLTSIFPRSLEENMLVFKIENYIIVKYLIRALSLSFSVLGDLLNYPKFYTKTCIRICGPLGRQCYLLTINFSRSHSAIGLNTRCVWSVRLVCESSLIYGWGFEEFLECSDYAIEIKFPVLPLLPH